MSVRVLPSEIDNQQSTMSPGLAPPAVRSQPPLASIHPSREFELLLAASSSRPDSERSAQISALLADEIDWSKVISLATHHAVIPVLYKRSEEHTSELQSLTNLVCRLLLE